MRTVWLLTVLAVIGCEPSGGGLSQTSGWKRYAHPIGAAEWNGAIEAPSALRNWADSSGTSEPGDRMVLKGTVYKPDGKSPAEGVLVYFYHTNARGVYPKRGDETGNARRHGYLRGWILTGANGEYEMRSIRPAGYPGRPDPAHIHITLTANRYPEHWIEETWFEGDERISASELAKARNLGRFSPVVKLAKDENGVWRGVRDLKLEEPTRENGGIQFGRPPE